jgi:lysophospholipase L1-like esterase
MMEEFYPDGEIIPGVIDTINVYHEKFRMNLAEKYNAPVNMINSGIGGDTVIHMLQRLDRDVLRYLPHLVLINASLNGPAGNLAVYEKHLRAIIDEILDKTEAEIILMTPNMMTKSWMHDLEDRVEIIKKVGVEKHLSVADVYAIWKEIEASGIDINILLSNRINHPVIVGHEICSIELMKLFE